MKYKELSEWILEQIETGALQAGDRMYSENTLCKMFDMSRQTVRHAMAVLEEEGILKRRQGSGTYINDNRFVQNSKKKCIGFITTYVDSYIFPKIIQGIEKELSKEGYSVQIAFTNNRFDREKKVLEEFLQKDEVAGLIVETTKSSLPNPNMAIYQEFHTRRIPVLFINSFYPALSLPHVSLNDRMAGRRMTEYLLEKGHTHINAIFKLDDGQGRLRYQGYLEVLQEYGIPEGEQQVIWLDTEDIGKMSLIKHKILERLKGCTAVCCYNDEVAYELTGLLQKEKLRLPEDMSIISIDDSELAQFGDIRLTTICHPKEILGEKAAGNILMMIRNPLYDGNYEFDAVLAERDSVRAIGI